MLQARLSQLHSHQQCLDSYFQNESKLVLMSSLLTYVTDILSVGVKIKLWHITYVVQNIQIFISCISRHYRVDKIIAVTQQHADDATTTITLVGILQCQQKNNDKPTHTNLKIFNNCAIHSCIHTSPLQFGFTSALQIYVTIHNNPPSTRTLISP